MNENNQNNPEETSLLEFLNFQDTPKPVENYDVLLSDYNPSEERVNLLLSNATHEELVAMESFSDKWAINALEKMIIMRIKLSPTAHAAPVYDCYDLQDHNLVGKVVGFVGFISEIWDQTSMPLGLGKPSVRIAKIGLTDGTTNVHCCAVCLDSFEQIVPSNVGKKFFFWGTVLNQYFQLSNESRNFFYLYGMTENIPLLKTLRATEHERSAVIDTLEELKTQRISVRDYIKRRVVEHFGIKNLNNLPDLEKGIDFIILQAFSHGSATNYINKIHSLVVGKPGRGKKLLTMIAKAINPIAYEVSTDQKKVTSAGLVGRVTRNLQSFSSTPGILPKTDGGVVCFQDAHYLKKDIHPILSKVMEDGQVEDSSVAMVTHQARVSIHMDLNRKSDLQNFSGNLSPLEVDLGMPRNIISRFDGIFHITSTNLEFANNVIEQILETNFVGNVQSSPDDLRDIKLLVAYVLDGRRHFQKSMRNEISSYIGEKLDDFISANESTLSLEGSDILFSRLRNSVLKILLALSYIHDRQFDDAMVDECISIIADKFNTLSPYFGLKTTILTANSSQARKDEVLKLINSRTSRTFSTNTIRMELAATGIELSNKTIERYLMKLAEEGIVEKKAHNTWGKIK